MSKAVKKKKSCVQTLATLAGISAGLAALYFSAGNILYEAFLVHPDRKKPKAEPIETGPETIERYKESIENIPGANEWYFALAERDVPIISLRGDTLHASIVRQPKETNKWAIFTHGYTCTPEHSTQHGWGFYEMGYNVLFPYLSGHGLNEKRVTTMGWLDRLDVIDWITYIVTICPDAQIVLYGVSMGAATAMMVTGEPLPDNVKCAVEDCGYTSVWDEFSVQIEDKFHLPPFPVINSARTVIKARAKYDIKEASALAQVQKSKTPTLFIHGEKDTFVPFWMLDVLYDHAACEKEKLVVKDAEHADSYKAAPELYWGKIKEFVEKYVR